MLSGNGTIDYDVEAHTLDAHKTSAARQESTTRNLHGSAAIDINTDHLDSKPVSTRQARIANLQRQIESLDKKLMRSEEDFESEENDESYERKLRRRRRLAEVLEELRSDRSYDNTTSTTTTNTTTISTPSFIKKVTSRMVDLSLSDETHISTSGSIKRHDTVNINNTTTKDNPIYFSSSESEVSQDDQSTNSRLSGDLTALSDFDDINYPLDTKEDIENPLPPVNSLLWRKDPMGTYIIFSTLDGTVQRFYTNVIGNKIRTKLNTLEDFPRWCRSIREFTTTYRLDDLVRLKSGIRLSDNQNALLERYLRQSLGDKMERYFMNQSDVVSVFSTIRAEYQNTYTAEHRERLWRDINIGRFCPDIRAADEILTDMVLNEQYGNRPEERYRSSREFINHKILETLNEDVMYLVTFSDPNLMNGNKCKVQPTTLISSIISFLTATAARNGVRPQPCSFCHSPLHTFHYCRKQIKARHGSSNRKTFSRNHGRENYEEKKPISGATISKLRLPGEDQAPKLRSVGGKQGQSKKGGEDKIGKSR